MLSFFSTPVPMHMSDNNITVLVCHARSARLTLQYDDHFHFCLFADSVSVFTQSPLNIKGSNVAYSELLTETVLYSS